MSAPLGLAPIPSVTEIYGQAWSPLKQYVIELFLVALVWVVIGIPGGVFERGFLGLLSTAYKILVVGPLTFGAVLAYLHAARGKTPQVADLFVPFQRAYWPSVLANLLLWALVVIGLVLLIVPGIVLAVRLSFTPYLVVDEDLQPVDAIKESWARTQGYGWTIFGLWLLGIPILLAGLLLLGVGVIPAAMWVHLAFATLYTGITASERSEALASTRP